MLFFFHGTGAPPALHSFPTRRSSDLRRDLGAHALSTTDIPLQGALLRHLERRGTWLVVTLTTEEAGTVQLLFFNGEAQDRKSTRLNSSHSQISYAVFCLKKKKKHHNY